MAVCLADGRKILLHPRCQIIIVHVKYGAIKQVSGWSGLHNPQCHPHHEHHRLACSHYCQRCHACQDRYRLERKPRISQCLKRMLTLLSDLLLRGAQSRRRSFHQHVTHRVRDLPFSLLVRSKPAIAEFHTRIRHAWTGHDLARTQYSQRSHNKK